MKLLITRRGCELLQAKGREAHNRSLFDMDRSSGRIDEMNVLKIHCLASRILHMKSCFVAINSFRRFCHPP